MSPCLTHFTLIHFSFACSVLVYIYPEQHHRCLGKKLNERPPKGIHLIQLRTIRPIKAQNSRKIHCIGKNSWERASESSRERTMLGKRWLDNLVILETLWDVVTHGVMVSCLICKVGGPGSITMKELWRDYRKSTLVKKTHFPSSLLSE